MFRWFYYLLYGSTPVIFESPYSIEDAVARLTRVVGKRSLFRSRNEDRAVGTVTANYVEISREPPGRSGAFRPTLFGSFKVIDGHTVLTGRFTIDPLVKIGCSFVWGFVILWLIGIVVLTIALSMPDVGWAIAEGIAILGGSVGFIWYDKWLSRDDATWLTRVIEGALR